MPLSTFNKSSQRQAPKRISQNFAFRDARAKFLLS
jgi:hypothetical protein